MIRACFIAYLLACSQPVLAGSTDSEQTAVLTAIRPPSQGFAISVKVPSPERCVSLGMNMAAELGIRVHLICISQDSGVITTVAECGFSFEDQSKTVKIYSPGMYRSEKLPYLMCVPDPSDRFPATQLAPQMDKLKRKH